MGRLGSRPRLVIRIELEPRLVGRLGSEPHLVIRIGLEPRLVGRLRSGPRLVGRIVLEPRLVGRLGSGVRVSASFKKCPPRGSDRVRTPPRGRQGLYSVYSHPLITVLHYIHTVRFSHFSVAFSKYALLT